MLMNIRTSTSLLALPLFFTTFQSQRAYAKVVGNDYYAAPSITWDEKRTEITHEGERISILRPQ